MNYLAYLLQILIALSITDSDLIQV